MPHTYVYLLIPWYSLRLEESLGAHQAYFRVLVLSTQSNQTTSALFGHINTPKIPNPLTVCRRPFSSLPIRQGHSVPEQVHGEIRAAHGLAFRIPTEQIELLNPRIIGHHTNRRKTILS